jgi:hypothetical protein
MNDLDVWMMVGQEIAEDAAHDAPTRQDNELRDLRTSEAFRLSWARTSLPEVRVVERDDRAPDRARPGLKRWPSGGNYSTAAMSAV